MSPLPKILRPIILIMIRCCADASGHIYLNNTALRKDSELQIACESPGFLDTVLIKHGHHLDEHIPVTVSSTYNISRVLPRDAGYYHCDYSKSRVNSNLAQLVVIDSKIKCGELELINGTIITATCEVIYYSTGLNPRLIWTGFSSENETVLQELFIDENYGKNLTRKIWSNVTVFYRDWDETSLTRKIWSNVTVFYPDWDGTSLTCQLYFEPINESMIQGNPQGVIVALNAPEYRDSCSTQKISWKSLNPEIEAPRLITKSPDQKLNTGESLQLFCNFSGVPAPVIKWFQQDYSGKRVDLSSEGESLSMSSVSKLNAGIYECTGDNGITPSLSAKINVTVHFKPEISEAYREIGLHQGRETMISCLVETSPVDRMFWKKDGLELKDGMKYKTHRWSIKQNYYILVLIISNVTDSDYGDYNCVAENSLGQASEKTTVHRSSYDKSEATEVGSLRADSSGIVIGVMVTAIIMILIFIFVYICVRSSNAGGCCRKQQSTVVDDAHLIYPPSYQPLVQSVQLGAAYQELRGAEGECNGYSNIESDKFNSTVAKQNLNQPSEKSGGNRSLDQSPSFLNKFTKNEISGSSGEPSNSRALPNPPAWEMSLQMNSLKGKKEGFDNQNTLPSYPCLVYDVIEDITYQQIRNSKSDPTSTIHDY